MPQDDNGVLMIMNLNQVSNIHWHLFNLSVIKLLNVLQGSLVFCSHEVDGSSFPTESTSSSDSVMQIRVSLFNSIPLKYDSPVNVVFSVCRQIIVDDERDLLYIDSSGQEISGDQDSRGTRSELLHDDVSLFLFHVSML
jgi:hypothetical protein